MALVFNPACIETFNSPESITLTLRFMVSYKARVLFFHGYAQSASVFYAKSLALRKKLQSLGYKCIYLNGPAELTPAHLPSADSLSKYGAATGDDTTVYRGWWKSDYDGKFEVESAIDSVKKYIDSHQIVSGSEEDAKLNRDVDPETDKELPITGLVGFSQGAAFIGILLAQFKELLGIEEPEFAVLYGGFKLTAEKAPDVQKYYVSENEKVLKTRLLHVVGELDTIVAEDRAYTLHDHLRDSLTLLKHPGGHFVPNSKIMINQVVAWIQDSEPKEETSVKKEDATSVDDLMAMLDKIGT